VMTTPRMRSLAIRPVVAASGWAANLKPTAINLGMVTDQHW
jgi:hypothetical protein